MALTFSTLDPAIPSHVRNTCAQWHDGRKSLMYKLSLAAIPQNDFIIDIKKLEHEFDDAISEEYGNKEARLVLDPALSWVQDYKELLQLKQNLHGAIHDLKERRIYSLNEIIELTMKLYVLDPT